MAIFMFPGHLVPARARHAQGLAEAAQCGGVLSACAAALRPLDRGEVGADRGLHGRRPGHRTWLFLAGGYGHAHGIL